MKNSIDFKKLKITEAELMDARNDLEQTKQDLAYYQNYTLDLLGLVNGLKEQLDEIYNSNAWKIVQPILNLKDKTILRKQQDPNKISKEPLTEPPALIVNDFNTYAEKNVLFFDRQIPQPDRDAGSRSILQYIQLLTEMGYTVKLAADDVNTEERYLKTLSDLGVDLICCEGDEWKQFIKNNASKIGFALLNRPNVALKYIDFIRESTNAKIIYLGCDLHYLRQMRDYELTRNPDELCAAERIKMKEFIAMYKADTVIMYSEYEKAIIQKEFGFNNVVVAPIYYYDNFQIERKTFAETKDILFVGGFLHKPNVDAVMWFYNEIWLQIKDQIPDARFIIAGSYPTEEIEALAGSRVVVTGFISDKQLSAFYADSRVCVIPLRFGAGIKGKTLEAIKNGIPIVSTSIGIEGIDGIERYIEPADTAEVFMQKVVGKYLNEDIAVREAENCSAFIRESFSKDIMADKLKKIFV